MTISQVQAAAASTAGRSTTTGTEVLLNMIPKVKFELVAADDQGAVPRRPHPATARTGGRWGDGKIFIFPVEEVVRIRTGETGRRPGRRPPRAALPGHGGGGAYTGGP